MSSYGSGCFSLASCCAQGNERILNFSWLLPGRPVKFYRRFRLIRYPRPCQLHDEKPSNSTKYWDLLNTSFAIRFPRWTVLSRGYIFINYKFDQIIQLV
jgi:hypothetical protein